MEGSTDQDLIELLHQVISGTISRERYFEAFEIVYRACQKEDDPDRICHHLLSTLRNHIRDGLENHLDRSSNSEFLVSYSIQWLNYYALSMDLQRILRHVDMQISLMNLLKFESKRSIKQMALSVWQNDVLVPLRHELTKRLIKAVNQDRKGKPPFSDEDLSLVVEAIANPCESTDGFVGLYETYKNAYLVDLEEYFWINLPPTRNAQEFLENTKRFIADELPRAQKYLRHDDESVPAMVHKFILANNPNYLTRMMETALTSSDNRKLEELYGLLKPINDGRQLMQSAIINSCAYHVDIAYVKNSKDKSVPASLFVDTILTIQENLRQTVQVAFDDDPFFELPCSLVCRNAVKQIETSTKETSAKLVANYFDSILDSETEEDAERQDRELGRALKAAKFVTSGEEFREEYLNLLQKRLLKSRWCKVKLEKQAVDSLSAALGSDFVDKLPDVLKDVFDSRFMSQVCRASFESFEATTLARHYWYFEASQSPEVILPKFIEDNIRIYTTMYIDQVRKVSPGKEHSWNPRRRLMWFHNMAHVEIQANFSRSSYLIKCPAFTAIVLLLFEEKNTLSPSDLQEKSGLSDVDFLNVLEQLEGLKLLTRVRDAQKSENSAKLSLNLNFVHRTSVVNLLEPTVTRSIKTLVEKARNPIDQQSYTEALLVRILKLHGQLHHDAIVSKVREEAPKSKLKDVDANLITECLVSLKDKQYIDFRDSIYYYLP